MDYIDSIIDFSEGELSEESEGQFFMELSTNKEMREELRKHFAMQSSIATNAGAYAPPTELTMGVFGAIGLNPKNFNIQAPAIPPATGKSFFSRFRQSIISVIATLLLITPSVFYLAQNESDNEINAAALTLPNDYNRTEIQQNILIDNPDDKNRINELEKQLSSMKSAKQKKSIEYVYVDRPVYINLPAKESYGPQSLNALDINNNIEKAVFTNKALNREISEFPPAVINNSPAPSVAAENNKLGISVEYRGANYFFSQTPTIFPEKYPYYNNTALSFMFDAGYGFSAGLEARAENFFVQYESSDPNGQEYINEQMPNLTIYSGLLRYQPIRFGAFNPFAQITAGGTYYGASGRIMMGSEYYLKSDIALIIGAEYSRFWYRHAGSWFDSDKWGINYGISFKM